MSWFLDGKINTEIGSRSSEEMPKVNYNVAFIVERIWTAKVQNSTYLPLLFLIDRLK